MKKFLLSLSSVVAFAMVASAAPITLNFGAADYLPEADNTEDVSTASADGVDMSFFHCKAGKYSGVSYLQVSGKNYYDENAAYVEFKLSEEVTSIAVHTGSNASTNVMVSLLCDGVEAENIKLDQKDATFTYTVPADKQAAGTVYRLTTTNKYNAQLTEVVFNPEVADEPADPVHIVKLDVLNAADIQGTDVPEVPAEGDNKGNARHVQPLESLEIDGYLFTFSQGEHKTSAPAYYWPMSTNENGKRSIRIYNGNEMTITAPEGELFNKITYIPDNSDGEQVLWSGKATNTITYKPSATVKMSIVNVSVLGEGGETPDEPVVDADVVFENTFASNLDGFTVNNAIDNDYKGWKMNGNPVCAIANSYTNGVNLPAESWLTSKELDLTNRTECTLSFEQGFGFTFPESNDPNYQVLVKMTDVATEAWDVLDMTEFPAKPESGNWTKEWAKNTFDFSKYEGHKITVSFVYKNDGSSSRAWEIKNFVVKGKLQSAVSEIEAENGVAEYYTLQGVKVANPENGLYIVVKNGKASKVIVK